MSPHNSMGNDGDVAPPIPLKHPNRPPGIVPITAATASAVAAPGAAEEAFRRTYLLSKDRAHPRRKRVKEIPTTSPSLSSKQADDTEAKVNMERINEAIARLQVQAESSTTDDRPTLASQAKTLGKKIGGKMYAKSCGGPAVCKNLLCTHPYVDRKLASAGSSSATPEPTNTKIIAMIMKKCADDGFPVTELYTEKMLTRCTGKIANTIKMIKGDITHRERALHITGRISVLAERASVDNYAAGPRTTTGEECYKSGLPKSRDGFISSLEHEDRNILEAAERGFKSHYGRNIRKAYKTAKERERILAIYVAEAKFREARATAYKEVRDKGVSDEELEEAMAEWEKDHFPEVHVKSLHFRGIPDGGAADDGDDDGGVSNIPAEAGIHAESDEEEFGEAPEYADVHPKTEEEFEDVHAKLAKELMEVAALQKEALRLVEEQGHLKQENVRLKVRGMKRLIAEVEAHLASVGYDSEGNKIAEH